MIETKIILFLLATLSFFIILSIFIFIKISLVKSKTSEIIHILSERSGQTSIELGELNKNLAVLNEKTSNLGLLSTDLSKEVISLNNILSNNQSRGAFGELSLEMIVKDILPQNYYRFQETLPNNKRVDCLIKLPGKHGDICIDSKYPHSQFIELMQSNNDIKNTVKKDFSKYVINHIKDIQEKYIIPGTTAEWAIMYVPSESVYIELNVNFQGIIQEGFKRKVILASPSTLWAILNSVRAIIRNKEISDHIINIQAEVEKIFNYTNTLSNQVDNLKKRFYSINTEIDSVEKSTMRIIRSSEKIISTEKE